MRSCGWEEDKVERECYTTVLEEYNTEVCSCDNESGCNGSTSVSPASIFSMTLSATARPEVSAQAASAGHGHPLPR